MDNHDIKVIDRLETAFRTLIITNLGPVPSHLAMSVYRLSVGEILVEFKIRDLVVYGVGCAMLTSEGRHFRVYYLKLGEGLKKLYNAEMAATIFSISVCIHRLIEDTLQVENLETDLYGD